MTSLAFNFPIQKKKKKKNPYLKLFLDVNILFVNRFSVFVAQLEILRISLIETETNPNRVKNLQETSISLNY